jgi:hypothetical protein
MIAAARDGGPQTLQTDDWTIVTVRLREDCVQLVLTSTTPISRHFELRMQADLGVPSVARRWPDRGVDARDGRQRVAWIWRLVPNLFGELQPAPDLLQEPAVELPPPSPGTE